MAALTDFCALEEIYLLASGNRHETFPIIAFESREEADAEMKSSTLSLTMTVIKLVRKQQT